MSTAQGGILFFLTFSHCSSAIWKDYPRVSVSQGSRASPVQGVWLWLSPSHHTVTSPCCLGARLFAVVSCRSSPPLPSKTIPECLPACPYPCAPRVFSWCGLHLLKLSSVLSVPCRCWTVLTFTAQPDLESPADAQGPGEEKQPR